ncbi:MAG: rhomboid family intramembrane serine protease [Prevotellaceae bacterium]|jgi:membrane associated rhomboid family serine protease|nr:rhomboid family intramembrane serine protease [Prevotellaceae bacterium]
MSFTEQIKMQWRTGGAHISLIYINILIFLLVKAVEIVCKLFLINSIDPAEFLAMPSSVSALSTRFWTPITYMFYHKEFWHILFNMLCLYWFGMLFLAVFSSRQFVSVYIFGGLMAAALYALSFNFVPYYQQFFAASGLLLGASGAIMAIVVAVAVWQPDAKINLLLIGAVKLKFVALAFILMSFFGLTSFNGGGEVAHLGGALAGWLFAFSLKKKNRDITAWINSIIDWVVTVFAKRKPKFSPPDYSRMSDAEFNINRARNSKEIDRILDKIKSSGYESLTKEEKQFLFSQGK